MGYYNNFSERLSRQISSRLTEIEAIYNFELGNETEIALCQILTNILPDKFGICRGFVVSREGKTAGDDIIIYDKLNFPLIRPNPAGDFSLKCQIPIEAVYVYIECKNSINEQHVLDKAIRQVEDVKSLLLTRESIPNHRYEKEGPVYHDKVRNWPRQEPKFINQPFGMIFTRQWNNSLVIEDMKTAASPDLFILGPNELGSQHENFGPDGIKGALFIDEMNSASINVESTPGNSFGIGIIMLLQVLNKIRLADIDWLGTLNDELFSQSSSSSDN